MTDREKLDKLVAYLMRRMYAHNQMADIGSTGEVFDEKIENAKYEECKDILNIIDSMIEEPNINGISSKQATGKLKECIDNITEESLAKSRKQMEENPKECMYARDNYTDEDRKVLCEGCEEKCKFNKKEEPVSEDLEKAAASYEEKMWKIGHPEDTYNSSDIIKAVKYGANWQKQQDQSIIELAEDHAMLAGMEKMKEQLMAKAVDAVVKVDAGGYPYIEWY